MNTQINNSLQQISQYIEQLETQVTSLQQQISDESAANQLATEEISRLRRQKIAERIIGVALCFEMQDVQYKFGGEWENDQKFDCSAFMQICYKVGTGGKVVLPRTSHQQSLIGVDVPFDEIEPGDLLIYDFNHDGKITHVAMAMDKKYMIHTNSEASDINIVEIEKWNRKGLVKVKRVNFQV